VDEYDEIANHFTEDSPPHDPKIDQAAERLRAFFDNNPQRLFYSTQIETVFERDFFHWITGRALLEMRNANEITRISEMEKKWGQISTWRRNGVKSQHLTFR
jgi:hypothetical protein